MLLNNLGVTQNNGEQIVKVMSDTACNLADCLQSLSLAELGLEQLLFTLGSPCIGNVTYCSHYPEHFARVGLHEGCFATKHSFCTIRTYYSIFDWRWGNTLLGQNRR